MSEQQFSNIGEIQQNSKSSQKLTPKLLGCLVLIMVAICILASLFGIFRFNVNSIPIYITEVVLATDIDESGNPDGVSTSFLVSQPRIYCLVKLEASQPVNVGIRWFLENDLIFQDEQFVDQRRAFYIEPLPGKQFPQGNYRVEIYLVSEPLRIVYFTIEQ